jgi:alkylation response protein AidB-like acyl-CoA dehydrogenase
VVTVEMPMTTLEPRLLAALSEVERALVARAARFGRDYVAPNAARWERERRLPAEAVAAAAAVGLTGIEVPREQGGQGAGFLAKTAIAEALAQHCMGFAFSIVNTQNQANRLARDAGPATAGKYLPALLRGEITGATALTEPHAGSDFPAIATTARRVDGGWVLDGEKAWITNAATARSILVYAQTDPAQGAAGIAAFLVDAEAPGFERLPPYGLMGGHAIGTGGFRLAGCRVAEADLLYPPGQAFKRALRSINGARTYVAAMCCGMVAAALRTALDHAARRHTFGRRLLDHQGLRWMLADVATDLEAARLLTYAAAERVARGENAALAAAHAKKFAVRMAQQRLGDCMQAMGAAGLRETCPIGRHIAGARIAGYVDGTTEMQNERIGALLEKTWIKGEMTGRPQKD